MEDVALQGGNSTRIPTLKENAADDVNEQFDKEFVDLGMLYADVLPERIEQKGPLFRRNTLLYGKRPLQADSVPGTVTVHLKALQARVLASELPVAGVAGGASTNIAAVRSGAAVVATSPDATAGLPWLYVAAVLCVEPYSCPGRLVPCSSPWLLGFPTATDQQRHQVITRDQQQEEAVGVSAEVVAEAEAVAMAAGWRQGPSCLRQGGRKADTSATAGTRGIDSIAFESFCRARGSRDTSGGSCSFKMSLTEAERKETPQLRMALFYSDKLSMEAAGKCLSFAKQFPKEMDDDPDHIFGCFPLDTPVWAAVLAPARTAVEAAEAVSKGWRPVVQQTATAAQLVAESVAEAAVPTENTTDESAMSIEELLWPATFGSVQVLLNPTSQSYTTLGASRSVAVEMACGDEVSRRSTLVSSSTVGCLRVQMTRCRIKRELVTDTPNMTVRPDAAPYTMPVLALDQSDTGLVEMGARETAAAAGVTGAVPGPSLDLLLKGLTLGSLWSPSRPVSAVASTSRGTGASISDDGSRPMSAGTSLLGPVQEHKQHKQRGMPWGSIGPCDDGPKQTISWYWHARPTCKDDRAGACGSHEQAAYNTPPTSHRIVSGLQDQDFAMLSNLDSSISLVSHIAGPQWLCQSEDGCSSTGDARPLQLGRVLLHTQSHGLSCAVCRSPYTYGDLRSLMKHIWSCHSELVAALENQPGDAAPSGGPAVADGTGAITGARSSPGNTTVPEPPRIHLMRAPDALDWHAVLQRAVNGNWGGGHLPQQIMTGVEEDWVMHGGRIFELTAEPETSYEAAAVIAEAEAAVEAVVEEGAGKGWQEGAPGESEDAAAPDITKKVVAGSELGAGCIISEAAMVPSTGCTVTAKAKCLEAPVHGGIAVMTAHTYTVENGAAEALVGGATVAHAASAEVKNIAATALEGQGPTAIPGPWQAREPPTADRRVSWRMEPVAVIDLADDSDSFSNSTIDLVSDCDDDAGTQIEPALCERCLARSSNEAAATVTVEAATATTATAGAATAEAEAASVAGATAEAAATVTTMKRSFPEGGSHTDDGTCMSEPMLRPCAKRIRFQLPNPCPLEERAMSAAASGSSDVAAHGSGGGRGTGRRKAVEPRKMILFGDLERGMWQSQAESAWLDVDEDGAFRSIRENGGLDGTPYGGVSQPLQQWEPKQPSHGPLNAFEAKGPVGITVGLTVTGNHTASVVAAQLTAGHDGHTSNTGIGGALRGEDGNRGTPIAVVSHGGSEGFPVVATVEAEAVQLLTIGLCAPLLAANQGQAGLSNNGCHICADCSFAAAGTKTDETSTAIAVCTRNPTRMPCQGPADHVQEGQKVGLELHQATAIVTAGRASALTSQPAEPLQAPKPTYLPKPPQEPKPTQQPELIQLPEPTELTKSMQQAKPSNPQPDQQDDDHVLKQQSFDFPRSHGRGIMRKRPAKHAVGPQQRPFSTAATATVGKRQVLVSTNQQAMRPGLCQDFGRPWVFVHSHSLMPLCEEEVHRRFSAAVAHREVAAVKVVAEEMEAVEGAVSASVEALATAGASSCVSATDVPAASDSDDETDDDEWERTQWEHLAGLAAPDSVDVGLPQTLALTPSEQQLMFLWNRFARRNLLHSDRIIPQRLMQFVNGCEGRVIAEAPNFCDLYRALVCHVMGLWEYALVGVKTVHSCLRRIVELRELHVVKQKQAQEP